MSEDAIYQKAIFNLLKCDPRNTLYSIACIAVPLYRRFESIQDGESKREVFLQTTKSYGWAIDSLALICVAKFYNENVNIEELKREIEQIVENLLDDKDDSSKEPGPQKLSIDKFTREIMEKRFNFTFNLGIINCEKLIPSWQTLLGPLLWFFLHCLATKMTEEFDIFLEHLHLFIGCMECSQHYYKAGRLFYQNWKKELGTKQISLFLIRFHNYVSKHGELIKSPRELDLRKTKVEMDYEKMYLAIFSK